MIDLYDIFKELALYSYSLTDLLIIWNFFRVLKTKNAEFARLCELEDGETASIWEYPARDHYAQLPGLIVPTQQSFVDYAEAIANSSSAPEGLGISAAQWDLVRGKAVDKVLIEAHLELLRRKIPGVTISPVINELNLENELTQLDRSERIILPIQKGGDWAFAVVYPDGSIQWYDSNSDTITPALARSTFQVSKNWFGPQQERSEDSGLFMLLGIRLLAQKLPHLPQDEAHGVIKTFRPRVLAELLCGHIDPSEAEFQAAINGQPEPEPVINGGHQLGTSFFEDATYGMDASRNRSSTPSTESGPDLSRTNARNPDALLNPRVNSSNAPSSAPAGAQTRPKPSPKMLLPKPVDERREILRLLSSAAAYSRIARLSENSDITLLCSYSNRQVISSEFHRRYASVLFHNASTQLGNSAIASITQATHGTLNEAFVKDTRSRCRVWKILSEIGLRFRLYEFVLLCVIPEQSSSKDPSLEVVHQIESRLLNHPHDPLLHYASKASYLCKAIVENTIHPRALMIELYPYREGYEMTDDDYDMYISTDPHVQRAIPRANRRLYR